MWTEAQKWGDFRVEEAERKERTNNNSREQRGKYQTPRGRIAMERLKHSRIENVKEIKERKERTKRIEDERKI